MTIQWRMGSASFRNRLSIQEFLRQAVAEDSRGTLASSAASMSGEMRWELLGELALKSTCVLVLVMQ